MLCYFIEDKIHCSPLYKVKYAVYTKLNNIVLLYSGVVCFTKHTESRFLKKTRR